MKIPGRIVAAALALVLAAGSPALAQAPLSQFGRTTSDQLRSIMTDASGTGALLFRTGDGSLLTGVGAARITVGTTAIGGGSTGRVLYDLGGVVGEYTISGSGGVAMTNGATLIAPNLGTPASGVLTNLTGLPLGSGVTGLLLAANHPALTGDITTPAGSLATTLATVATAGTSGGSTAIPIITINAKGLTTAITTAAVIAPAGTLSGSVLTAGVTSSSLTSVGTLVGGGTGAGFTVALGVSTLTGILPAANHPALTGDITTASGAIATTLATVATAGTSGGSTAIPVVTINAKGLTTSVSTAAVIAPAGTLSGTTLAAGVTASSLTSLGTIAALSAGSGTFSGALSATNISASGSINAGTTGYFPAGITTDNGIGLGAAGTISWGGVPLLQTESIGGRLSLIYGTNATNFYAYNTYTDASNYERAQFGWSSGNVLLIGTRQAGTGVARSLQILTGNTVAITVASNQAVTLASSLTGTTAAFSGALSASNLSGSNTGDQTISLTGDVTGSGTGSFAATLAAVATAGTTGSSTAIPVVTINAKGLTTAINTAAVVAPAGTLTGATLAAGVTGSSLTSVGTLTGGASGAGFTIALGVSTITGILPAANHPALTGDITTASGAIATTLATVNANVGSFGSATQVGTFTVNAKGLVTAAANVTITPAWSSITGAPTTLAGYGIASPLPVAQGGDNCSVSSGTCLDNITGFSGTGFIKRTGAGTYTFTTDPSDVTSVFGRVGAVVAATNDYSFGQISGSVAASQLPNPSATTLGGVESYVAVSHQWINAISTAGVPSSTQPACGDLSNASAFCSGTGAASLTGTLAAAQEPAHTGDVTNSAGSLALTLATVNSNVGTFGSATYSPTYTVNGKGQITAALNVLITPAWGSITGVPTLANSVSNSDGSLTISPTTGAVVASLALGHANTWTATQTISRAGPNVIYDAGAALYKYTSIRTSGLDRWLFGSDNVAESGSNAGSNFFINNYADSGTFLGTPLSINRASGNAIFSGTVSASNLSGTNTGDQTITLTGDVTGSGTSSFAATLASVATAGTTGSSTAIPVITINAKGLTTGITTAAVIAPAGTLTGSTLAAGVTASSLTSLGTIAALSAGSGSFSGSVNLSGDVVIADAHYFYTPYNGATNTGLVRAGIQLDGAGQGLNFYTANTYRGQFNSAGTLSLNGGLYVTGVTTQLGTLNGSAANFSSAVSIVDATTGANRLLVSSAMTGTTQASNIIARFQTLATGRDVAIQLSDNITYAVDIGMVGGTFYVNNGTNNMSYSGVGLLTVPSFTSSGAVTISGTLTGAAATFSGALKTTSTLSVGSTNVAEAIDLTGNMYLRTAGAVIYGSGQVVVQSGAGQGLSFRTNAGPEALGLASSGAATFAGAVSMAALTATSANLSGLLTGVSATLSGQLSMTGSTILFGNTLAAQWKNGAGTFTGGTAGTSMFAYSDNTLYIDQYDTGTFKFRGTAYALLATISPTGLVVAGGLTSNGVPLAYVQSNGALCNGSTDDRAAFAANDAASTGPINVPPGTCIIGSNITLAHQLVMQPGAVLSPNTGVVITLALAPLASSQQKIFAGVGTVVIAHPGAEVYAEWWGAKADNSTASAPAFQLASNALTGGGTIRALPGYYQMACASADAVTITNSLVNVYGAGDQVTWFVPSTNCGHFIFNINPSGQSGNMRDFGFNGSFIGAPYAGHLWSGVYCANCGVNDFQNIQLYGGLVGFNFAYLMSSHVTNIYMQGCAFACIILGGGALDQTGAQHVSIDHFTNVRAFNLGNSAGTGMIIDSGTSEISIDRFVEGGLDGGILIRNTYSGTGAHRPEGIRIYGKTNLSANTSYALNVAYAWNVEFSDSNANGTTGGPNVILGAASGTPTVDGFLMTNNAQSNGANQDNILIRSACNVAIRDAVSAAAGASGTPSVNTYSAIHATQYACGNLEITNSMLGEYVYGNFVNQQKYSLLLDADALKVVTVAGISRVGRLFAHGNMMRGNQTGSIADNSGVNGPQGLEKAVFGNMVQ